MTCVNEYCRRSRAHRFTRKQLHRIKHLPWVRADLTHVQTPHGFICSIRASCVAVLTGIVYGWWQDSLHQRVISMKGRVHTLKWDIRKMPWKETAGKVLSAKTIQRQAVKKKIWLKLMTKGADLLSSWMFLFIYLLSAVLYLVLPCSILKPSRIQEENWLMYLFFQLHHKNEKRGSKLLGLVFMYVVS